MCYNEDKKITHVDRPGVSVGEVLVVECDGGPADGVEVGDVCGHGLRDRRERREDLDVAIPHCQTKVSS